MSNSLHFFDLFAGIGGFHSAAIKSSNSIFHLEPSGFCEFDPAAAKFYQEAYKEQLQFISDANDIKTHRNGQGIKIKKIDILFAGFPCQSFSNVGYRKGFNDERGKLFYTILDILEFYKPKYFILENVQKISTIKKGGLLEEICLALEEIGPGYNLHTWDLRAFNYGLPQNRRRMFFCGVRKDLSEKLDISEPKKQSLDKSKYPTAWHLLEKNNIDPKHYIPTKTRETVLYKNPKWMGDVNIDNHIARPITASMSKWHRANQDNYFSDSYVNGNNPYDRPTINLEKEPIRRITPLEGFRLQGFPDQFEKKRLKLEITSSVAYRLIGNAVPVNLAKAVITHFIGSYENALSKGAGNYKRKNQELSSQTGMI